ncbi:MAG: hypothetical protein PUE71_06235 [Clostridia bacterium]|nr:hypothetical protein [Clostridia bacterium]
MDDLKEEVEAFLKSQVRVTFRGKNIFDAREVQTEVINENECCMRDFVLNDYGRLIQVNYDIVKDE